MPFRLFNSVSYFNENIVGDWANLKKSISNNWYKIAKLQEETAQPTFDFLKDVPQVPIKEDPLKEYQEWIGIVNPRGVCKGTK